VLEWRGTIRAVLFSILPALHDWRVGLLSESPARVFVFRREDRFYGLSEPALNM